MLRLVVRRLLSAIPVLFGVLVVTFVLARVAPGDACQYALGERATEQACANFREAKGLDDPMTTQFVIYVGDLLQGDFGESLGGRAVSDLMVETLPVTVQLTFLALSLAVIVGIPLGVISAYRHNSAVDVGTVVGANVGVSMPVFWLGLMLQYLFAVQWEGAGVGLKPSGRLDAGLVPTPFYEQWNIQGIGVIQGFFEFVGNMDMVNAVLIWRWDILVNSLQHLAIPAITLATIPLAIITRMTRSSLLDTLGLDYVRTARAKGLREFVVVSRHALRNSLLPVVTVIGLSLGTFVGGAILTETVFGITGVGRTLYEAIVGRDYPVIQGFTLTIALAFVLINLLTDIIYTILDPKVRVA